MTAALALWVVLRTVEAGSIGPHHVSNLVPNTSRLTSGAAPESPNSGEQQARTAYAIVQSCFWTIFACVWTSIHPNIPGPRDSGWTCLKRKIVTTLCALIAPEVILFWALQQSSAAKWIADRYNFEFARVESPQISLRDNILAYFHSLPKGTTWRGVGQRWSTTHGFFIQMGGFLLYEDEYPAEVLDFDRLAQLLRDRAIDQPTVTEENLQDRSKGDAIAKLVVMMQTSWFVLQCFARLGQHLPLSELEVVTLASAVVNTAIYSAWWSKPQGVNTAICLPLRGKEKNSIRPSLSGTNLETSTGDAPLASFTRHDGSRNKSPRLSKPDTSPDTSDGIQLQITDDSLLLPTQRDQPHQKRSWIRRMLRKDRTTYSSPVFVLYRIPARVLSSVTRQLLKIGESNNFEGKSLRVPMFYASKNQSGKATVALLVVGVIFGAIHFAAWTSAFPSRVDQVVWRASAIVLTVAPALLSLVTIAEAWDLQDNVVVTTTRIVTVLLLPLYIGARLAVFIVAFYAIRKPPPDVLSDISWTSYIPHL